MKAIVVLLLLCLGFQSTYSQKKITIYWDASYSMKDRQLNRELLFLNKFFQKNKTASVKLVMFSNAIILQENYKIDPGNWDNLKAELKHTIYDGATSYSNLFKDDYDECFLFTDGVENLDILKPPTNKPIHIISTLPDSNAIQLKLIADLSSGSYVYLTNQFNIPESKEKIEQLSMSTNVGYITGFISGAEGPLENVSIINKSTNQGIASGINGSYKIKAKENDILVYTYLGKKTVNIRVTNVSSINVSMQNIDVNLDEIVVTAENDKEELVNTGNTTVDKKRLGYTIVSIGSDEISSIDTDVKQAVKGQFAGLKVQNNAGLTKVDLSQFLGRGNNMTITGNQYGLVVLDGIPLQTSDSSVFNKLGGAASTSHINPDMIVDITYLKGLAATNKYGTLGANGVLLITTKNAVGDKATKKKKINLGTTATYSGNATLISGLADTPYINKLKLSKSIDEAFNTYLTQRKTYGNEPEFYLDVYDYFEGWNNEILSKRVLSNIYEIAFDNPNMLRALSYKQQAKKNYDDAIITLQQVLKLKQKQSQSYRDLALAYTYANDYNKALKIYNDIDKNIAVYNSNFNGLKKTITNDAKSLISRHKEKLNISGVNPLYLRPIKYKARIVFEWNNLNSEFDLDIINPQKRFFTWSHTRGENFNRIEQEHEQGYGLEEFYLTSSDVGEWTFNIKFYGNYVNVDEPTYVKITTYKNFGSANETKDIQVIKLAKKNIEQTVSKVVVN